MPATGLVGSALVPEMDDSMFVVDFETPPGSNLAYTRAKAQEAARIARRQPEVAYTYTAVAAQGDAVDEGTVFVKLTPKASRDARAVAGGRRHPPRPADAERLHQRRSASASTRARSRSSCRCAGVDARELTRVAEAVAAEMRQVPGAVDVGLSTKGQKPELDVQVDRGLAGSLGVTVGQVAQALRPAFAGIDVGDWIDPSGETRDVTVRISPQSRTVVADLESLPIVVSGPRAASTSVPLGQVARVTPSIGPARIDHLNRDRVVNVEANTQGRPLSAVVDDTLARIETSVTFPPGYALSQGGEPRTSRRFSGRCSSPSASP